MVPSLSTARAKLDRTLYGAQQLSLFLPALAAHRVIRALARQKTPDVPVEVIREIRRRYADLLAADVAHVEAGVYPSRLRIKATSESVKAARCCQRSQESLGAVTPTDRS